MQKGEHVGEGGRLALRKRSREEGWMEGTNVEGGRGGKREGLLVIAGVITNASSMKRVHSHQHLSKHRVGR